MRTKKQLLQLLLDNIDLIGNYGLCFANIRMQVEGIINNVEYMVIDKIISMNPVFGERSGYYFPKGDKQPRIEYLQRLIKVYEND